MVSTWQQSAAVYSRARDSAKGDYQACHSHELICTRLPRSVPSVASDEKKGRDALSLSRGRFPTVPSPHQRSGNPGLRAGSTASWAVAEETMFWGSRSSVCQCRVSGAYAEGHMAELTAQVQFAHGEGSCEKMGL